MVQYVTSPWEIMNDKEQSMWISVHSQPILSCEFLSSKKKIALTEMHSLEKIHKQNDARYGTAKG